MGEQYTLFGASLVAQVVKNPPAMQETLVPFLRSAREGKGYPLQYSGLKNSMDCTVHEVMKSQTGLRGFHFLSYIVWGMHVCVSQYYFLHQ